MCLIVKKTGAEREEKRKPHWLFSAWPYLVFGIIGFLGASFTFGATKNETALGFLKLLVDLVVGLAIVIYVIYTRDLAKSSQVTADANLEIVRSMRSQIVEEWVAQERAASEVRLCRDGDELSRDIHLTDLGMPRDRFERKLTRDRHRVLIFKAMNTGTRVILLRSVKFQILLSPGGRGRELVFAPEHPIAIRKDEYAEVQVVHDFEGQIEARVVEIDYLDGDQPQTQWVANPWREGRYFEPEGGQQA